MFMSVSEGNVFACTDELTLFSLLETRNSIYNYLNVAGVMHISHYTIITRSVRNVGTLFNPCYPVSASYATHESFSRLCSLIFSSASSLTGRDCKSARQHFSHTVIDDPFNDSVVKSSHPKECQGTYLPL